MKIAILGFGREGQSTLQFLQKSHLFKNDEFWIVDKKATVKIPHGVHKIIGKNYMKNLGQFDIVFRTPGIPYMLPELVQARKKSIVFSSLTKLFFQHVSRLSSSSDKLVVIGITGTKGKGTTSTLLYNILHAADKPVFLAGNIGKPALDILPRVISSAARHKSYVILELSSFQLQDLDASPHIAAILDIFPDHQENIRTAPHGGHATLREYLNAKANIARFQKSDDFLFYLNRTKMTRDAARLGHAKKIAISGEKFSLFKAADLAIRGEHNYRNAVLAATIAETLHIPRATIKERIKKFRGLPHRLEFVRRVKSTDFYNDSFSTSPQPTIAAMRAFPENNVVLIAGGHKKKLDYTPFARALSGSTVSCLVLMGTNQNEIARAIRKSKNKKLHIIRTKNLRQAVLAGYASAKSISQNREAHAVVLFSPATSSFDQFKDYADRGEQFKKIVKSLRD